MSTTSKAPQTCFTMSSAWTTQGDLRRNFSEIKTIFDLKRFLPGIIFLINTFQSLQNTLINSVNFMKFTHYFKVGNKSKLLILGFPI